MNVPIAPASLAERLTFDSDAHPRGERLARYRAVNAGGAEATEAGPEFRATVRRWRLDRAVLHERWLNDVIHEVDPARLGGLDHFMLTLVRAGRYEVDIGGGFAPVAPGAMVLLDMTRPMRSLAGDAHVVTTSLAREVVTTAAGPADDLHGLVLGEAEAGLLADFLVALVDRVDALPASSALAVTQVLAGLVGMALDQRKGRSSREPAADAERLARVRWMIEQRLAEPRFGPEKVIADTGLSRATLYRLFQPHGGLAAYLRKRRLDRVRVALSDPHERRSLAALAADSGFASESHCSRLFAAAFGVRPGEYRAARAEALRERLGYWFDELK